MAEFMDVMEQVKRMCSAHRDCRQCALYNILIRGVCAFDYLHNVDFNEVEHKVNAWAKEHPDNDSNVAHSMKTTTVIAVELNDANTSITR